MDSKNLISLIIPAYNISDYLERCLDSIISQTYSNFEVIIVDDGSTDDTPKISDRYQDKDDRIRVFHISNGGVCNARNIGLANARGEWIGFIDADDWIENNYLEVLIGNAILNDCSISACRYINDSGSAVYNDNDLKNEVHLFSSTEDCVHNFICPGCSMEGMVWNKIYKASLLENIRFDSSIRVNEDCVFTFEVMSKCNRACLSEAKLYHWYFRKDSACRRLPDKIELNNAAVFLYLLGQTEGMNDIEIERALKLEYIRIILYMLINVQYSFENEEMQDVKYRLIEWKDDVFKELDKKRKRYYNIVVHYPRIMNIIRIKNRVLRSIKDLIKQNIIYER